MTASKNWVFGAWITGDPRINAQIGAALGAVSEAFPFVEPEDMLAPPYGDNVAALARQILLHVLINTFGMPKKRVAAIGGLDPKKIKIAARALELRALKPRFAGCLQSVSLTAAQDFSRSEYFHG